MENRPLDYYGTGSPGYWQTHEDALPLGSVGEIHNQFLIMVVKENDDIISRHDRR
jgi:hypothetical protein